jgi:PAS domain S-box-containing protein
MTTGAINTLDPALFRERQFVALATRWIAVGFGLAVLIVLADQPATRVTPALSAVAVYAAFALASAAYQRRHAHARALQVAHDTVDVLALVIVAWLTGGSRSPVALVLYPHVVATAVRGGFRYALIMGTLDAVAMATLAWLTPPPDDPLASIHAVTLWACALMAGTASRHLHAVRAQVHEANRALEAKNDALRLSLQATEAARAEQEQALALARASETRYRNLLERIQDGVLIIQDGQVAYCNEVFAAMAGEARGALLGRDFLSLAPPEDRAELRARYTRWEQVEQVSGLLESRLAQPSGEVRLVSLRAGSVDYRGRRAIITTVRDITRERGMERELQANAERLAALNEIANAVNLNLTIEDILTVAADESRRLVPFDVITLALLANEHDGVETVTLDANGASRGRAAFSRRDVAWAFKRPAAWSRRGLNPAPPHARELLGAVEVKALASQPLYSKDRVIGSLQVGRRDDAPFAASDLAVLEPVARHIAIALDNARLLEAVRQRSHEFESLLDIGRGILQRLQLDELLPLVTRSVNRVMGTSYCLLLLRSGNELRMAAHEGLEPALVEGFGTLRVGQSLSGWVAQHGRALAVPDMCRDPRAEFIELAESHGYRGFLCVPLRHGDEVIGTLEVLTRQVRTFTAEEQELMSAFGDQAAVAIVNARLFAEARQHLAQVSEANRRLQLLDAQRQEYLRNVSHEFRTPLTVIKGYAEYLRDTDGTGDMPAIMRVMLESCDRLIDMVDTLIEVGRVEQGRGRQGLYLRRIELRELAEAAIEPLRLAAERKQVRLEFELPETDLGVEGDAGLLEQLVRKLVDNAVKYSTSPGRVVLRARLSAANELELEVEDNGIGIAAEHLPHIFDKFYMVDGGLTRRVGGAGVGLYLVREIVRLHDGRVEVRSTPGEGSLFRVVLPRAQQGARAQAATTA